MQATLLDATSSLTAYAVPAATVGAAAFAAIAAYMAGSWKVREAKLTYAQRIRDTYLENARKVAGDVYVPLAIAMSALARAYGEFRNRVDFDTGSAPAGSVNRFKGASNNFLALVEGLLSRGASAYLTLPLEELLTDFVLFLEASLSADRVVTKVKSRLRFIVYPRLLFYQVECPRSRAWSMPHLLLVP